MIEYQLIFATVAGIALLLFLILRLKIQAFLSLLIASIVVGLLAGMPGMAVVESMKKGMGDTLGFVATIVGLGALFGAVLEHSGGAQSLANGLLKTFGTKRAPTAMGITGFIVAIPVFFDVGFIILVPIIYALQRKTGKSLLTYALPLLVGLGITHGFIPPTPGPVAVADIIGANLGWVILVGIIAGIPTAIVAILFSQRISNKIFLAAPEALSEENTDDANLPNPLLICSIIVLPILLIVLSTVASNLTNANEPPAWLDIINFLGHPFTALIIANLIAWYILGIRRGSTKEVLAEVSLKSLGPAGLIILLTGAGGVLKQILIDTGVGVMMAEALSGMSAVPVVIAFVLATLIRVMQGSATVAMITAAGIMSPILADAALSTPDLALIVVAIASGATMLSHVNDSGFWLINRYLGMTEKDTFRSWTVVSSVIGLTGLTMALLLSFIL